MGSKSQVAVDDADRERMERERLSDEAKKQKKYRIPGLLARKSKPKSESSL